MSQVTNNQFNPISYCEIASTIVQDTQVESHEHIPGQTNGAVEESAEKVERIRLSHQFSELLPSADREVVDQVMSACGNQFHKFKSLFQIFKNNEKFALRIAELIGSENKVQSEFYNSELHEYLIDFSISDGVRNEATPNLLKWLNDADESKLEMLMHILEWKLFEVQINNYSGQYPVWGAGGIDHFFVNSPEEFQMIYKLLEETDGKNRVYLVCLIESLKESDVKGETGDLISLAFNLVQNGIISYRQIETLQHLSIPNEKIFKLNGIELQKCLHLHTKFAGGDFERYLTLVMRSTTHPELEYLLSLEMDLCDFILDIPEDSPSEIWENYVTRKPGWGSYYHTVRDDSSAEKEYLESQIQYGMMMHHSIKIASLCLDKKNWGFDELLKFLVMRRRHIAFRLYHPQRADTGILKDAPCETYCDKDYQEVSDRLWDKYKLLKSAQETSSNLILDASDRKSLPNMRFVTELDGETIELSIIEFRATYVPGATLNRKNCALLTHTSVENAAKIMKYVSARLYPEFKAEKDPNALVEKAGEIFWWICAAKPWIVGDPSKAELLFRTIWSVNGCESPPWKKGVIPWVEATSEPDVKVFAKKFHSFFEWSKK